MTASVGGKTADAQLGLARRRPELVWVTTVVLSGAADAASGTRLWVGLVLMLRLRVRVTDELAYHLVAVDCAGDVLKGAHQSSSPQISHT